MSLPVDLKELFAKWLEAEYDMLSQRGQRNAMTFSRAFRSVKNCEDELKYPEQLINLKYVGEKMVKMMASKLKKHCEKNGFKYPEPERAQTCDNGPGSTPSGKKRKTASSAKDGESAAAGAQKKKRKRKYVPGKNTGGYAILLALLVHDTDGDGMTKNEVIRHASQYCSTSFTSNPQTGQYYSAWSSVKTLINNDYVYESSTRPVYYSLTAEGEEVAKTVKKVGEEGQTKQKGTNANAIINSSPSAARVVPVPVPHSSPLHKVRMEDAPSKQNMHGVDYRIWTAGSYNVIFVSDNREVRSKNERDFFSKQLEARGVPCSVKPLAVGDGLWVAEHRASKQWAVLNVIFERKRLDDLASSIVDGRFREQKSRLERTGLKRVMYLIEEQMSSDISRFSDSIQTAMASAITFSNFHLKRTKDSDATVQLIMGLDERIKAYYADKSLVVLEPRNVKSQKEYKHVLNKFRRQFEKEREQRFQVVYNFDCFQSVMNKSNLTTVGEMFVRMLMTVRGVSLDKAIVIQKHFKTPRALIESYQRCPSESRENMIRDLFKEEIGIRKIGPKVSKNIYEVWGV